MEENIIRICAMQETVEGSQNSESFGLPSCSKRFLSTLDEENVDPSASQFQKDKSVELVEVQRAEDWQPIEVFETENPTEKRFQKEKIKSTSEILEKELSIQRELCNKLTEGISVIASHQSEMGQNLKRVYRSIDRLYDQQKEILKETTRHNKEMERLKKYKIESKIALKKELLEIEKAKLETFK